MSVGRICVRTVHCASPGESVREAARRMARADVGTLVVTDDGRLPLGVLTDRDVMRCAAGALDLDATTLEGVMSRPAVTIEESAPIEDALAKMATREVRRLVVTDRDRRLVGILSIDDVLELLASEASAIARLLGASSRSAPFLAQVAGRSPPPRSPAPTPTPQATEHRPSVRA